MKPQSEMTEMLELLEISELLEEGRRLNEETLNNLRQIRHMLGGNDE
jgi:hypothetical protein